MSKRGSIEKNLLPRDIIMRELRQRIRSSLPGTRLPSENALSLKFNMARMTVTRVFKQLEQEGLERRNGCSSFVRGMRTVTFFLPYPKFILSQHSEFFCNEFVFNCFAGVFDIKQLQPDV